MSSSFATLSAIAQQVILSMEFSKQEYQSGLPFPPSGDLPDSGIKPAFLGLAGGFFTINIAILLTFTINGTPLQYSGLENPMDGGAW